MLGVLSILLVFLYVWIIVWPAIGTIIGVFVGGAQALAIKQSFASQVQTSDPQQRSLHWLGKTTLAFSFWWLLSLLLWLGSTPLFPGPGPHEPIILAFASAIIAGAFLGGLQRDLLKRLSYNSAQWLAANILGACAFTLIVFLAAPILSQRPEYLQIGETVFYSVELRAMGVLTLAAFAFSAVTGIPLARWSANTNGRASQIA
jgi:hypothetical protein